MTLTPGLFAHTTTFLLGSEKHAGKTTLLNYLVRRLRGTGELAYLSVGVDGEGNDAISGAPKPQIVAAVGDWLVTAQAALERSSLAVEIHEVFPFRTIMGPSVLARIRRGGPVELVGPGTNAQLAEVLEYLAGEAGVETVLVDGAINRVTQVASSSRGAIVFVVRVTRANLARAVETMWRLFCLQEVPLVSAEAATTDAVTVTGALTPERVAALDPSCRAIVVEDFSHVFLTRAELLSLQRRVRVTFQRRLDLRALVVNLYDVSRQELLDRLGDAPMAETIVFNPYQEVA